MRGLVHHVVLTVRDPARSFPLYDAVLTALGYRLERENERGFGWELETPSGFSLYRPGKSQRRRRQAPPRSLFAGTSPFGMESR